MKIPDKTTIKPEQIYLMAKLKTELKTGTDLFNRRWSVIWE
jgi:hypothetical protein